jgi:nucleoside-diphosphate-sugar epimerase
MRVLVTGGNGKLGRWVNRELAEHGHVVVSIDRQLPREDQIVAGSGIQYREADLIDVGQVIGALIGCDAVIHLGAIPVPWRHPDEVVFGNNTGATFAVLHAAATLGVRKAVIASSVAALGMFWAPQPFFPLYAPVDEAHPVVPHDPYGLSKAVDEHIGAMVHRRTGMTVLAYRFHWIMAPDESATHVARLRGEPTQHAHNLWGYVDIRDAARACRLGIEAEELGFEPINIIAADTLREEPTEELIRQYCPGVELRAPIPGTATGWSIDKARQLLGYVPQYSWRDNG